MINLKDLHFESFRVDSKCTQMLHTTKDYKDVKVDADISTSQIEEKGYMMYSYAYSIRKYKEQKYKVRSLQRTLSL